MSGCGAARCFDSVLERTERPALRNRRRVIQHGRADALDLAVASFTVCGVTGQEEVSGGAINEYDIMST